MLGFLWGGEQLLRNICGNKNERLPRPDVFKNDLLSIINLLFLWLVTIIKVVVLAENPSSGRDFAKAQRGLSQNNYSAVNSGLYSPHFLNPLNLRIRPYVG